MGNGWCSPPKKSYALKIEQCLCSNDVATILSILVYEMKQNLRFRADRMRNRLPCLRDELRHSAPQRMCGNNLGQVVLHVAWYYNVGPRYRNGGRS